MNKLSLNEVCKMYGAVTALRPTSLDVPEGQFLTLLGPSGSGKSTMLQLLAGLTPVDGGKILIDGVDATEEPPHARGIGMVFQNYALFPHLTVEENIAFPLEMRRLHRTEIQRRVKNILEVVDLPDCASRLPSELSGGQQQRIAFARCAVYEPSVILMDEPLGALDKRLRDQMQSEIRRIHKSLGATILYVTHDQEEAMSMSDRICVMNHGGIEQMGSPWDIYFHPRSIYTAEFVGSANLLSGTVTRIAEREVLVTGSRGVQVRANLHDKSHVELNKSVTIMVRPESIRILDKNQPADNKFEGVVEDFVMLGPSTRLKIRTEDGTQYAVVLLSHLDAISGPGEMLWFGWDAAQTAVLCGEASIP